MLVLADIFKGAMAVLGPIPPPGVDLMSQEDMN